MEPSTFIDAASLSTSRLTSGAPPTASTAPTELSDPELLTSHARAGRSLEPAPAFTSFVEPGARPRDWTESPECDWVERVERASFANHDSRAALLKQDASAMPTGSALARSDATPRDSALASLARSDADATPPGSALASLARSDGDAVPSEPEPASPARLEPRRYKVQFEA